jgi:S1-C subfamily serine protease
MIPIKLTQKLACLLLTGWSFILPNTVLASEIPESQAKLTRKVDEESSNSSTQIIARGIDSTIKPATEINEISHRTTILIYVGVEKRGSDVNIKGIGSGSLIAKQGNTCIAVTNRHVVLDSETEELLAPMLIRTHDDEIHAVGEVTSFKTEDLAIVQFECTQNYQPIPLAQYPLSRGQEVYLSGYPPAQSFGGVISRQFTSGAISTILKQEQARYGYTVGYTNVTQGGMSGGQVLDAAGRLVAIHGWGDRDGAGQKTGFNYGIPVSTLLRRLSQAGLNYSYQISNSLPQEPASGNPVSSEPVPRSDPRDRVNVSDLCADSPNPNCLF